MGSAGAAIAKCDDVFTTLDVFTTRQFQNHHLVERWHGFEVEAVRKLLTAGNLAIHGRAASTMRSFPINQLQFGQANKVTHMIDALGSALADLLVVFP